MQIGIEGIVTSKSACNLIMTENSVPLGFWGSGENGYLFLGSRGAHYFQSSGKQALLWGLREPCQKVNNEF